jgi:hypothetical protein
MTAAVVMMAAPVTAAMPAGLRTAALGRTTAAVGVARAAHRRAGSRSLRAPWRLGRRACAVCTFEDTGIDTGR